MKFLPKAPTPSMQFFSGIPQLDHYVERTKDNLNYKLPKLLTKPEPNLTRKAKASIKALRNSQQTLTIKPADKCANAWRTCGIVTLFCMSFRFIISSWGWGGKDAWGVKYIITKLCLCILCRQLSATSVHASRVGNFDKQLSRQIREGSQMANYDTQTLRVQKMSLDNRYS